MANAALSDSEDDFALPGQDDSAAVQASLAPPSPPASPILNQTPQQPQNAPMGPSNFGPDSPVQPKVTGKAAFLGNLLQTILAGVRNSGGNPNNAFDRGFMQASPQAQQQRQNQQQMAQAQISKAQSDADLAKAQTSLIPLKALQYEYQVKALPQQVQDEHMEQIQKHAEFFVKNGAEVVSTADDEKAADAATVQARANDSRSTNHLGMFMTMPDPEQKGKFSTMYFPNKELLQKDLIGKDGQVLMKAGTPLVAAVGKAIEDQGGGIKDFIKDMHGSLGNSKPPETKDAADLRLAQLKSFIGIAGQTDPVWTKLAQDETANIQKNYASLPQTEAAAKLAQAKAMAPITIATHEAEANAKNKDQLVVAGEPGKQETQVMTKGQLPQGWIEYPLKDPQALASTVARFNDVQTKVNTLADFVDRGGMEHIQPGLVGDAIAEANKEFKLGAFGAEIPTSRLNSMLDQENYKAMNQQSRDFVRAYAFAREAMTQLPAIQTFGKSNRINDTQLKAALQLLPDHKMAGDTKAASDQMRALQAILDPLRKSLPTGLPGAVMLPSFLERGGQ